MADQTVLDTSPIPFPGLLPIPVNTEHPRRSPAVANNVAMDSSPTVAPAKRRRNANRRHRLLTIRSAMDGPDLISQLPDECVQTIFGLLPYRDRCTCAAVSKKWLLLLAHMRGCAFASLSPAPRHVGAFRCLEAHDANDARVAAMAVGTYARKLLIRLSLRGGVRMTDVGVQIVCKCFPNLTSLSLWDCYNVGSDGLTAVAGCCPKLQKLDIFNSSNIGDVGLATVAERCLQLSTLVIDSCARVGDRSMLAFARCSRRLESIHLSKCPFIGAAGVAAMISGLPKLARLRLSWLKLGDDVLEAIGERRGNSVKLVRLENVDGLSATGVSWIGDAKKLETLTMKSCERLADGLAVEGFKWRFNGLRNIEINNCGNLTDIALFELTETAQHLDALKLKKCDSVTSHGIIAALKNCRGTLKAVTLVKCNAVGIEDKLDPLDGFFPLLESLTLKKCIGLKDPFLGAIAPCCIRINHIELVGLHEISDVGVVTLLQPTSKIIGETSEVKVNLSGCVRVTDKSVMVVAMVFKGRLRSLILEGCVRLGDMTMVVVGKLCTGLAELDVSGCDVGDEGVARMVMAAHQKLEVLSLEGCRRITDESLTSLEMMCMDLVALNLRRCRGVSAAGVRSLRDTLWGCSLLR